MANFSFKPEKLIDHLTLMKNNKYNTPRYLRFCE